MSKLRDSVLRSISAVGDTAQDMYIKTRMLNEKTAFTETSKFPWGDRDMWHLKSKDIGTYLFFLDNIMVYAGQGIICTRLGISLGKYNEYKKKYGRKKVPPRKTNEKWVITPKIYNMCGNIKRWSIRCIIFHTGLPKLDKEYAKNTEDQYIDDYNLRQYGLNTKKGDNT